MKISMHQAAEQIAKILAECNTDHRGDLLVLVSRSLRRRHMQYFTATCVDAASLMYGVSGENLEEEHGRTH